MDPLFVGNILQHCHGELVVSGLGELHVHLHCLVLCCHHETNGTTNSSLVSLRSLARPENGAPKLGMTGSLHEKVLGKECSSLLFQRPSVNKWYTGRQKSRYIRRQCSNVAKEPTAHRAAFRLKSLRRLSGRLDCQSNRPEPSISPT